MGKVTGKPGKGKKKTLRTESEQKDEQLHKEEPKETKAKSIKAEKHKKIPEKPQTELTHTMAFWGLAILLFLPPYFRGLFFQPEQERALIFAAVVFWFAWLWKWSKRDYNFLSHPLDYFVLAFPVVYLISAFQAANAGLAVDEVVKTTLYFMVFWLASRLVRNDRDIVTVLNVIYISAIGVALAGLATATGIIHINDGFLNGRIYSTFQYPNALASFLAAATFIGFYLWRRAGSPELGGFVGGPALKGAPAWMNFNNINRYLYAAGNFILFAVLLGTKSQGGLLVFAGVFAIFVIGLPKGNRIPVFIHFVLVGLLSFIAILSFLSMVAAGSMGLAWLWVFAGLALVLAGQALYSYSERKRFFQWISTNRKVVLVVVLLVIVSGCIGAGVYVSSHSDTVKTIVEEIRLRSATERFYFFNDAIKMFKERPILGWGGGGWQEAYRAYQGYLYNSNQVHGHYFQIMVETGIPGLLVILGIWMSFLYLAHRLYHGTKGHEGARFLIWTITIAALVIGFHAAIDFDLSLSALALVLWTMFGLARGIGIYSSSAALEEKKSKKYVSPNYSVLAVVSVASVIIVMCTGTLALADDYAKMSGDFLRKQNLNQGIAYIQKASAYNPLNADYHSYLASIYRQMGKYEEGIDEAQKALGLSKFNAQRYADLATIYYSDKNSEEAVNYAEKALSLAPFQIQWYEFLSRTCFTVGYNELVSGNREAAKQYFEKTISVPSRIEAQIDTLDETGKRFAPKMNATPAIKLNVGAAQYLLGNWIEADANLKAALKNEKSKGEASLWLAVLRDKQGKAQEAQDMLVQAQGILPEFAKNYEDFRKLEIIK